MRPFMDQDFLLSTETAKALYHGVAKKLPIIDYHCHINPQEIYEDRKFDTITQVWLGGDHYKWRLMRTCGVPEELVTGNGDDREKFRAFAATMPKCMGHPVYHWSHLELQRYFGITKPLTPATADEIYDEANSKLQNWSARKFITASNVKAICTTDDPIDDLKWHKLLAADETMDCKVLPTFRPDNAVNCDKPGFAAYIAKLADVVGYPIQCADDVKKALLERIDYFHKEAGCLVADHGMDFAVYGEPNADACERAFQAAMAGEPIARADADAYKTMLLIACAKSYTEKDMAMQIHFGCLRNNNKPMWRIMGPDHGHDAVNSQSGVECLGDLLNSFVENDGLPKTILYSLSPADNTAIVTVMQCFQGGMPGKLQHGSAWWFNDSRPGMRKQMEDLAGNGVLGQFVGMLTDSRSFLSYTRHEYFRRILCELVGEWVEAGMYPNDPDTLESFIADLCFYNTNKYFNFNV